MVALDLFSWSSAGQVRVGPGSHRIAVHRVTLFATPEPKVVPEAFSVSSSSPTGILVRPFGPNPQHWRLLAMQLPRMIV